MSLEILNQLEEKIQQTASVVQSLQQEVASLRQKNQELDELLTESSNEAERLESENNALKQDHVAWQEQIGKLLNKIGEISQ